ncbi:MAG: TlpA family protein disulfide reductase [Gammaproteobacteria bacterium]|nr:TlpA family protein disulfide reductase [Gammaproteobacteria bacterium]
MTAVQPFTLRDLQGDEHSVPTGTKTLMCFVKEDCPTCNLVAPILEAIHQDSNVDVLLVGQTSDGNQLLAANHSLTMPVLDDSTLIVSFAFDLDTVPHTFLLDDAGEPIKELIGFTKKEWRELVDEEVDDVQIDFDELPEWRPGCGSLTQDPLIADRLRAESENSPLRARRIEIGAHDDVHEFLFDQGFTDGLPVVPPTPERVIRMLSGIDREPQEVVATIPPNLAPATIEKIAINAVLAGCKAEYLPVVVATIEAICTDEFNCHGVFATTMGATPVMILNGPVRHALNMNMKLSSLGQGTRSNASIGRAVRLAIRNIGGAKPGGTERSTLGNPMKFTMCFPEWEERSPWEPLHVERGFESEDSVVSVFAMSSGPAQVIDQTSRSAEALVGSFAMSMRAMHHVKAHRAGDTVLIVCPEHIDTIQRDGWSKADVRARIQEVSSVPFRELIADSRSGVGIPPANAAKMSEEQLNRLTPKFASEDLIHIVVAGSEAGKFSAVLHGWASGEMGSIPVSRKIDM